MSKADRYDALRAYADEARRLLGLTEWRLTISRDAADLEAWADIDPHSQANTAELRVSADFWRQTPERQREILAHELTHLLTCRTDQTVDNLEDALGKVAWSVFSPQYEAVAEQMVDRVSLLLAPLLPLPRLPR